MKMIDIIRLKFHYIINKNIIISFVFSYILIIVCLLIEVFSFDKSIDDMVLKNEYLISSYLYIKLFLVILSIYIFSYSVSFKVDFLVYLLIPLGVKKEKSILTSIVLNILLVLFFHISIFISFSYIGLFIDGFIIDVNIIISFLSIYFVSIIFGLYSMLLFQVCKNSFSLILMIAIFILSNNLIEYRNSIFIKVLFLIIPSLNDKGNNYYGLLYLIFYSIVLTIINSLVYKYRDLNF